MNKTEHFLALPERLRTWHKVAICVGLYLISTATRAFLIPPDGVFIFGPYYPSALFVFFFCGRALGMAFILAGLTTGMLFFTPPERLDVAHVLPNYVLSLVAGVILGEFFRVLAANAAELRATRARYKDMVELQHEWVFRLAPDGAVLFSNPAGIAALGFKPGDIPGARWQTMVAPQDITVAESRLAALTPEHPVVEIENRVRNARGDWIWAQFSCRGLFDATGRLLEIQSVARDVTARKHLEQDLKSLAAELADLYQNAPCAYYSLDADGVIVKANARLLQWLGAPAEEVIGKVRLGEFYDAEGRRAFYKGFPEFVKSGQVADREYNLISRDGTVRCVSVSANAQFDAQGRFVQSRSVMLDITDRKRAEQELKRFSDELEARVKERTTDLLRAHREMESFSYSVSHDLRAPLRAVNGLAAILLEDYGAGMPEGCVQLVERMRDAGKRMGLLVDGLLALARLDLGRLPEQPLEHEPMVREIFCELQAEFDPAKPMPALKVGPLPPCRAQPPLLRQVWQNLLSNAIKYGSQGDDACIEVGCDTSGAVPAYYVRDNGEGFDTRFAGKLFQAFERLHSDKGVDGHGIGLAIVKRIVEQHGGRAWAQSVPGVGATFYFTLAPEPVPA